MIFGFPKAAGVANPAKQEIDKRIDLYATGIPESLVPTFIFIIMLLASFS
jgi:hypothetical protein